MARKSRALLVAALVMLSVGLLGLIAAGIALFVVNGDGGPAGDFGTFSSNGERIYFTGVGHDGPIRNEWDPSRSRWGMMGRGGPTTARMGCANCHGSDGRGRALSMMGGFRTPDIRYGTLTSRHGAEAAWTEAQIAAAIRDGIEPDGEELDPIMPRWDMDETDMADTIDYLKELDQR